MTRKAPVCPFCTGCTNCLVFLCSRRPTSPVLRDEKTDQMCFSSDSRRPVELRLQEDVCSVREYGHHFKSFIRVQTGLPLRGEVAENLDGVSMAALVWVNPIFT